MVSHMEERKSYHGIIIEQSLRDKTILNNINIVGINKGTIWTLLKVSIESNELENFANLVHQNLIDDNDGIPYYAHF